MDPRDDPFIDQDDAVGNESGGEEEASESEEEEIEEPKPVKKARRPRGSLLTGRGVTMQMLIDENILQAGEKLLSIDYLGRSFDGDLLSDGQIRWCETGQIFSSPSSWAMYCKKLVNPTKKSGCGWASVRYKGKKLDQFKSTWFRSQKQKQEASSTSESSAVKDQDVTKKIKHDSKAHSNEREKKQRPTSIMSPISENPIMSPNSEPFPLKSPPFRQPVTTSIDTSPSHHTKPFPQKSTKGATPGTKRPPGRPPRNKAPPIDTRPPHGHGNSSQYHGMAHFGSPPHHPDGPRISPTAAHHSLKSPPPSHHPQHHSRPAHFSPPIPGRTGNVMTFSEALELVKNQSARKMEQAGSYDSGRAHSSNAVGQPRMSTIQQPVYTVHGRVYKRKPGRPPKDQGKAAAGYNMMMPHSSPLPPPPTASSSRGRGRRVSRSRMSLKHATVHPDSDPLTLVECAQFASIGKIQPFSVTFSTNALLVIDFHCHLSTSEVTGYLAGKFDASRQHLKISQAYPCKCRIADREDGLQMEAQIREDMERSDQILVGWYHSHPFCQPDPTLQDIKNQLNYQQVVKDENSNEPCIGLIVSPYDSHKKEAAFKAFWIQAQSPMHPDKLPLALSMSYTTHQDQLLTQDVVNEMVALVNFYKGNPDSINFTETWTSEATYLEKIKHSAIRKFPQDQTDGRLLDFITKLLIAASA